MADLKKSTFDALRRIVFEEAGIALTDNKQALVSARVSKRLRALGLPDYDAYLQFLANDTSQDELVAFLDAISTNVTSFFREAKHFEFLTEVMAKWLEAGQTRFRLWSAAASTGEEPYTIAMTLREVIGNRSVDVKLLATDISTRVLRACKEGVYAENKLEGIPRNLRAKYFRRANGTPGHYAVSDDLKRLISFHRLNLSTPPFPMKGPMDVVFCRNVMIYFDNTVRRRLLEDIHRLLKPGGYLMVGHAESLTGLLSTFKVVRPSVYIKA